MMNKFEQQGLNYVPYLAKSSSPSSPRSCFTKRFNKQRLAHSPTSKSESFYNGRYESDAKMYEQNPIGDSISHTQICPRHFMETDSECDYRKTLIAGGDGDGSNDSKDNTLLRFKQFVENKVLTTEELQKVNEYTDKLNENCYYRGAIKFLGFCSWLLMIIFSYMSVICKRCSNSSYGLIRCRLFLRNVARRILWWMTLAKCGDVSLFALILIACPVLFLVAIIGMSLALYCIVKGRISEFISYLRERYL